MCLKDRWPLQVFNFNICMLILKRLELGAGHDEIDILCLLRMLIHENFKYKLKNLAYFCCTVVIQAVEVGYWLSVIGLVPPK